MPPEAFASARVLQEQRAVTDVELGIVTETGETIWTNVSAVPVDFFDWQVIVVTLDITGRQRAQVEREALLAREQVALGAVEQALDRLHWLQQVTVALVEALTPEQVGEVLVQQIVGALGAQTAALALRSDNGRQLSLVHAAGYPTEVWAAWQRVPIDAGTPLVDYVQTGQAIYLESPEAIGAGYPHLGALGTALGTGAWVMVPLISAGQTLGGLQLTFAEARTFTPEERAFLWTLAQLAVWASGSTSCMRSSPSTAARSRRPAWRARAVPSPSRSRATPAERAAGLPSREAQGETISHGFRDSHPAPRADRR